MFRAMITRSGRDFYLVGIDTNELNHLTAGGTLPFHFHGMGKPNEDFVLFVGNSYDDMMASFAKGNVTASMVDEPGAEEQNFKTAVELLVKRYKALKPTGTRLGMLTEHLLQVANALCDEEPVKIYPTIQLREEL